MCSPLGLLSFRRCSRSHSASLHSEVTLLCGGGGDLVQSVKSSQYFLQSLWMPVLDQQEDHQCESICRYIGWFVGVCCLNLRGAVAVVQTHVRAPLWWRRGELVLTYTRWSRQWRWWWQWWFWWEIGGRLQRQRRSCTHQRRAEVLGASLPLLVAAERVGRPCRSPAPAVWLCNDDLQWWWWWWWWSTTAGGPPL